jgi:hypothetical protein
MSLLSNEELPSPVGDPDPTIFRDQPRPLEILYQDSLEAMGLAEGIAEPVETAMAVVVGKEGLTQYVAGLGIVAAGGIEGQRDRAGGNGRLPAAQCVAK